MDCWAIAPRPQKNRNPIKNAFMVFILCSLMAFLHPSYRFLMMPLVEVLYGFFGKSIELLIDYCSLHFTRFIGVFFFDVHRYIGSVQGRHLNKMVHYRS